MEQMISGEAGLIQLRRFDQSQSHELALICHPHPLYGGTMDNKVVTTIEKYFQSVGAHTVTFNFRGVMKSEGIHDHTRGEVEDALTVLKHVLHQLAETQTIRTIHIAGFSFGAYIASVVAHRLNIADGESEFNFTAHKPALNLTLVAPVVDRYAMNHLNLPIHTKVIVGEQDELVESQKVLQWSQAHHYSCQIIPQASHFFHGKLADLRLALD